MEIKSKQHQIYRLLAEVIGLAGGLWLAGISGCEAWAGLGDNPRLTFSPDGRAFTTEAGNTDIQWYAQGTTVAAASPGRLETQEPGMGEHLYAYERQVVSIGRWEVVHERGMCIHSAYTASGLFHGVEFGTKWCGRSYFSGWVAYCADCGERISDCLIYMSMGTAASLHTLDTSMDYYYKCPWCDNLEQGRGLGPHICQSVSANQYYVEYVANGGAGRMERSVHMYGNAASYEGQDIVPQRVLSVNGFERDGYLFDGWNSRPDGSGRAFTDKEEIYNLCAGNEETYVLYAQWKQPEEEKGVTAWPVRTTKLQLIGTDNIAAGEQPDVWYVRADGATPFSLSYMGVMEGEARGGYQINRMEYMFSGASEGGIAVEAPERVPVEAGVYSYKPQELKKWYDKTVLLADTADPEVVRMDSCRIVEISQSFTAARALDGGTLRVVPRTSVWYTGGVRESEAAADQTNGLSLVLDGRPPDITGMEQLNQIDLADQADQAYQARQVEAPEQRESSGAPDGGRLTLTWHAGDDGSGLRELCVEIANSDNGQLARYTDADTPGYVSIEFSADNPVFQGSFHVTVRASDRVGNETVEEQEVQSFGVTAYVERILEPHTPVFKCGESGMLHITATGYADSVEVYFPEEYSVCDPELDRRFVYQTPQAAQREECSFMIPLAAPEGEWQIVVLARKNGDIAYCGPELLTITVRGSVLEELRTRLR